MDNVNIKSLAVNLYRVYGDSAEWKNYQDNKMPEWDELPENIQKHWTEVAKYTNELINEARRQIPTVTVAELKERLGDDYASA